MTAEQFAEVPEQLTLQTVRIRVTQHRSFRTYQGITCRLRNWNGCDSRLAIEYICSDLRNSTRKMRRHHGRQNSWC